MTPEDFGPFKLSFGSHKSPQDGMCVMEMVSFLAGEPWSDQPRCVCPIIAEFCRTMNDNFEQTERDWLQAYVPRLIGTASPFYEKERAEYLFDRAVNVFAGMSDMADGYADDARLEFEMGDYLDAAISASCALGRGLESFHPDAIPAIFETLEGLLSIGPSGTSYTSEHINRIPALQEAVKA